MRIFEGSLAAFIASQMIDVAPKIRETNNPSEMIMINDEP
jgi:hypothetical protein